MIVKLVFNSPPLKMLIINYLLLAICFLTQVAVLAAPLPSSSGPSGPYPPNHDAVSGVQMTNDLPGTEQKTRKNKFRRFNVGAACAQCHYDRQRCENKDGLPCKRCKALKISCFGRLEKDPQGVSLSLWRPLFSFATREMT